MYSLYLSGEGYANYRVVNGHEVETVSDVELGKGREEELVKESNMVLRGTSISPPKINISD